MDAAKVKKLEEYSLILERQAREFETQGEGNEAAKIYVKLVDILLLLAREAPDHPTWLKYSTKAESFQKKAKVAMAGVNAGESQAGKTQAIKRIFGLKPPEEKPAPAVSYDLKFENRYEPSQIQKSHPALSNLEAPIQVPRPAPPPQEPMIAKNLYDQLVEKNKKLEEKIASMVEKSEFDQIDAKCAELKTKLADSVPLAEYEDLRQRLEASVPRTQYEELRQSLSGYVPRAQYEDLQNILVNLVPREHYDSAQARISELESQLAISIPSSVLDNLAGEISLLAVTASIPLGDERKSGRIEEEIRSMKQRLEQLEYELSHRIGERLIAQRERNATSPFD